MADPISRDTLIALRESGDQRDFTQVQVPTPDGGSQSTGTYVPTKQSLRLDKMFDSEGLQFQGTGADGKPYVKDPQTGEVKALNVDKMLAAEGLSRNDVDVVYNTPKNPVQESPVSPIDRATYATIGNTKGFVNKLKRDFDAVTVDENNGIVVKKGDAWYAVDPGITANHSAHELATDLLEVLPGGAVTAALTGGALALAGAPIAAAGAAAAGAAVLGGIAYGTIRTSLGRFLGTYDAPPEEQIFDIGMEGLANLGGHLIAPGGEVTKGIFGSAARKVVAAGGAAKEAVASMLGMTSGAGREVAEYAIEQMPRVMTRIEGYAQKGGGVEAVRTQAQQASEKTAGEWLETAQDSLQSKFRDGMVRLFGEADKKGLKVSMRDVVSGAEGALSATGLGKFVEENGAQRFVPLTEQEKVFTGAWDPDPETFAAVKRMADSISRFRQVDELAGGDGARRLVNLNKQINRVVRDAQSGSTELQAAVNAAAAGYKTSLGQAFSNADLGKEFVEMNAPYIKYSDIVDTAKRLLQQDNGVASFVRDVVRPNQARNFKGEFTRGLLELTGDAGKEALDKISLNQAAFHFAPIAPKLGLAQMAAIGSATAAGSGAGPLGAVAGMMAAGTATSPRLGLQAAGAAEQAAGVPRELAIKVLPYARQLSDAFKAIPAMGATSSVLKNPQVIGEMLRQTIGAAHEEDQTREQLLRAGGVK
jgi:hypothetical protein